MVDGTEHSAIRLKRNRKMNKDKNKEVWLRLEKTHVFIAGRKERNKIKRRFGESKQGHGFAHCRYIGKVRFAFQVYLTTVILNFKQIVKLLTGNNFNAMVFANECPGEDCRLCSKGVLFSQFSSFKGA